MLGVSILQGALWTRLLCGYEPARNPQHLGNSRLVPPAGVEEAMTTCTILDADYCLPHQPAEYRQRGVRFTFEADDRDAVMELA